MSETSPTSHGGWQMHLEATLTSTTGRDGAAGREVVAYLEDLSHALLTVPERAFSDALQLLNEARAAGRRVYVMGNGGSAAIASQFVCNFAKTAQADGARPIRAFALTDNTPALTAWANDTEYRLVFARQIAALAEPG